MVREFAQIRRYLVAGDESDVDLIAHPSSYLPKMRRRKPRRVMRCGPTSNRLRDTATAAGDSFFRPEAVD
jgi:hypothetical protein